MAVWPGSYSPALVGGCAPALSGTSTLSTWWTTPFEKAIEKGKGKAVLATMGGGTLTATKDGDKLVLTDAAGGKATVTRADDAFSNGVVHHVDTVLMPAAEGAPPPTKAGE